jgi:pantothenate kinase type III
MAKALQDYTAQLPLVEDFCNPPPSLPGRNTVAAIAAGIHSAVFGGIERIIEHYEHTFGPLLVAAAGGDAKLLRHLRRQPDIVNPWLTLEGIRLAAQHRHDA